MVLESDLAQVPHRRRPKHRVKSLVRLSPPHYDTGDEHSGRMRISVPLPRLQYVRCHTRMPPGALVWAALLSLLMAIAACDSDTALIVFTSERDGDRDIYSIDLRSLEEKNLTSSSRNETLARVSPSNNQIAFMSERNGRTVIETLKLVGDSIDRVRVSEGDGSQSGHRWSPDGSRIAYIGEEDGTRTVFSKSLPDARPTRLTYIEVDELGPWSPDGNVLLFVVHSGETKGIYSRNPDGVNEMRLTVERDTLPVWSPDSKRIAFISMRNDSPEIYVMNADGSDQRALTNNDFSESDMAWSPDGRRIAYVSDADGNAEIYTIKPDGSDRMRLTTNSIRDVQPVWSADSSRIAFVSYLDDDSEIVIMNRDGTGQQRLTNNDANDFEPDW